MISFKLPAKNNGSDNIIGKKIMSAFSSIRKSLDINKNDSDNIFIDDDNSIDQKKEQLSSITRYNKAIKKLHSMQVKLEANIKEKDIALEILNNKLDENKSYINVLKEKLVNKDKEYDILIGKFNNFKETISEKDEHVIQLRVAVYKLESELKRMNEEVLLLNEQNIIKKNNFDNLNEILDNTKKLLYDKSLELEKITNFYNDILNENKLLKNNLETITIKHDTLKESNDNYNKQIIDLNLKLCRLENEISLEDNIIEDNNKDINIENNEKIISLETQCEKLLSIIKEKDILIDKLKIQLDQKKKPKPFI